MRFSFGFLTRIFTLSIFAFLGTIPAAWAVNPSGVSADFSKGVVLVGKSIASCGSPTLGAVRYNSVSSSIEFCNGSQWTLPNPMVLISTQTAAASASLSWTGLGSAYLTYKLVCTDIVQSSTTQEMYLQFGQGATPTWRTANYTYAGNIMRTDTGNVIFRTTTGSGIILSNGSPMVWGNNSEGIELHISNLASTTGYKIVSGSWTQFADQFEKFQITGQYTGNTTAVTALRLLPSGGTITSGKCSLYGING